MYDVCNQMSGVNTLCTITSTIACIWMIFGSCKETRRVGPVDNTPSTDYLHKFVKKEYRWHVTCDTWHMTMTGDRWWTLCQSFRSLGLMVWDLWFSKGLKEKDDSISQWINHCRNNKENSVFNQGTWKIHFWRSNDLFKLPP